MSSEENGYRFKAKAARGQKAQSLKKTYGTTVRVNRRDFEIVWCDEVFMDGRAVAGLCDNQARRLFIDIHEPDHIETLVHEIMHAEFIAGGYRQRPDWTLELEEMLCELVSNAICGSFRLRKQ